MEQESKGSKQQFDSEDLPILAIDYGEKRVGLAISDSKGMLSSPLRSIRRTKKRSDEGVVKDVIEIAKENGARSFLIGKPQIFAEPHQKIVDKISSFSELLEAKSSMKIWYYDESFSSQNAQEFIRENNRSLDKRSGNIDKISAALFLQEFLDGTNKNR